MPMSAPLGITTNESLDIRTFIRLFKVHLLTVNLVLRYAVTDTDLPPVDVSDGAGPQQFLGAYPGTSYEGATKRVDLQVDTLTFTLPNYPLTLDDLGTRTLAHWAALDVFDNAIVDHYVWDITSNSVMKYARWYVQAALKWSYDAVTFQLESIASRMDRQCPRTLVAEQCNNKLYDPFCTLVQPQFTAHCTIDPSITPTRTVFAVAVASQGPRVPTGAMPENWFALGPCTFMSPSVLAPVKRMVLQSSSGVAGLPPFLIVLSTPLPFPPSIGDKVDLAAGCDKTAATCQVKFNNIPNYRGYPYTPSQDNVWVLV